MPARVPFNDLRRAHDPLRESLVEAITQVYDRGWFLRGPEVDAFEREWAAYCGQAHCVACNSGTDALTLAALASNLTTATVQGNTLPLTPIGLRLGGARVSIRDVGADGRMAPDVPADGVPVLLYGRLPSAAELEARLFDAAHAHGWRPPAHAVACWSFYPTKTLGALGDGGAVTTNDAGLAERMRGLCGRDDRLRDGRQITSRMDEIQAAVLRIKLRHLDDWIAQRRAIARLYAAHLPARVSPVSEGEGDLSHLYVVRTPDRDRLMSFLAGEGIETKVHFPDPLHRQDAPWGRSDAALEGTEAWCANVLTLPCFPGLRADEVLRVCRAIERAPA